MGISRITFFIFFLLNLSAVLLAEDTSQPEVLIVVHMAARNDLSVYAAQSLRQLKTIGSTDRVKIFIRLDIQKFEEPPVTKHFFIDDHKIMQIGPDINYNSGDAESIIQTVELAYERFPAKELVLIFWSHATGPIEPYIEWALNPAQIYTYNSHLRFFQGQNPAITVRFPVHGI